MSCNDCDNPCHSDEPATTPGGLNGQVQYNRSGAFAGAKNLITDGVGFTQAYITGDLTFVNTGRRIVGDFTIAGTAYVRASTTQGAPIRFAEGVAPTTPADGSFWFQADGLYVQVGGVTVGPLGTGSGEGGQCPYYVPVGETFTVVENKQVLWARPITVDGSLVVDGILVEVD